MLTADITQAAQLGLNARLLNEASEHDPMQLDTWLATVPDRDYLAARRVQAYLVLDDAASADHDA
jgi:hypothetical protein